MKAPDLSSFPHAPGVYLFRDARGTVIYVGKSVNLRSRAGSYFQGADLGPAKNRMVRLVASADWVEARNETEALVLETNLIKRHAPKFNVLMKDDKNLSYVAFSDGAIPEISLTRLRGADGGKRFGPYSQFVDARRLISLARRVFRVRSCRMKFAEGPGGELRVADRAGRSVPCMDHYIGLCPAPCLLEPAKVELHLENVRRAKDFFAGRAPQVAAELEGRMRALAAERRFEEAASLKKDLDQLRGMSERQSVRDAVKGDCDAVVFLRKYGKAYAAAAEVRDGMLVGNYRWELADPLGETDEELSEGFIARRYAEGEFRGTLLLERLPTEAASGVLSRAGVSAETPSIGPKAELLAFARNDLFNWAHRLEMATIGKKSLGRAAMVSLFSKLGLAAPARGEITVECYDISHLQGTFTVASRSVVANGKSDPSRYRKYKVKTLSEGKIDDFASMREVLSRRAREGLETKNFPSLLLIDGGKGQLSAAVAAMGETARSLGADASSLPPVVSLAKREEEVFLPGESDPVILDKGSPELMVLQKARDEAHRFAVSFNRASRAKAMTRNILDEIPGIGPATRRALLKEAGSVDGIRDLPPEKLATLANRKQIVALRDHGIVA